MMPVVAGDLSCVPQDFQSAFSVLTPAFVADSKGAVGKGCMGKREGRMAPDYGPEIGEACLIAAQIGLAVGFVPRSCRARVKALE